MVVVNALQQKRSSSAAHVRGAGRIPYYNVLVEKQSSKIQNQINSRNVRLRVRGNTETHAPAGTARVETKWEVPRAAAGVRLSYCCCKGHDSSTGANPLAMGYTTNSPCIIPKTKRGAGGTLGGNEP